MKAYQFSIPGEVQTELVMSFRRLDGDLLLSSVRPLPDGSWPNVFVEPGVYQICEHGPDDEPSNWREIEFKAPAPEPCRVTALERRVDALEALVKGLAVNRPAAATLDELEAKKTNLDRAIEEAKAEEPPEEIAKLMDPSLTTRQNLDALIAKYAKLMSEREYALKNGDESEAMRLLKRAETIDSGIKWNRARLAEVI